MCKILARVLLCLLVLTACGRKKEEPVKEPQVLNLVPSVIESESWREHTITILMVCDLEAEASLEQTPWASIASRVITGNGQTSVCLQLEANEGDEPRTGTLVASCGKSSVRCKFTQQPIGSNPGIYNFGTEEVSFDELRHQCSVRRYPDGTASFRILDPSEGKTVVFRRLPRDPVPGSTVEFDIEQNWMSSQPLRIPVSATLVKAGDGKLWLAREDAVFIVRI